MGSNGPVMNESTNEMIYEMNHIYRTADMKSSEAMQASLRNC